jgi:hypothetical protein
MNLSEEEEERGKIENENIGLRKDYKNIALLLFLYLLQGLPLGLNSSMTYILSSRKVLLKNNNVFNTLNLIKLGFLCGSRDI